MGVRSLYTDRDLTCVDCGQTFVFTSRDQEFYAQRSFSEPRRCPTCRAAKKAQRESAGGGDSGGGYSGGGYGASGGESRGGRRLPGGGATGGRGGGTAELAGERRGRHSVG